MFRRMKAGFFCKHGLGVDAKVLEYGNGGKPEGAGGDSDGFDGDEFLE